MGAANGALRKAAAKGKWSSRAAVSCAERDATVAEKITQQNVITTCLLEQAVEREIDVRQCHARLARSLQEAALQRLLSMKPGDLSPKLAVEMLKAGIDV